MIGQMDRRAALYNPVRSKEASGGYGATWAQWGDAWVQYRQNSGKQSQNGFQDNLFTQATITFRYNELVGERLTKDTACVIRDIHYSVVDFKADVRKEYVTAEIISKKNNSQIIPSNDLLVQDRIYTITAGDAGDGLQSTFTVSWLLNKTVISCITGRAIPCEVITTGTPNAMQVKVTSATAQVEVSADAPLVEGEKFEFFFR